MGLGLGLLLLRGEVRCGEPGELGVQLVRVRVRVRVRVG